MLLASPVKVMFGLVAIVLSRSENAYTFKDLCRNSQLAAENRTALPGKVMVAKPSLTPRAVLGEIGNKGTAQLPPLEKVCFFYLFNARGCWIQLMIFPQTSLHLVFYRYRTPSPRSRKSFRGSQLRWRKLLRCSCPNGMRPRNLARK